MIAATILIDKDTASPALKEQLAKCDPHVVATKVAVAVSAHWKRHLAAMPHNRQNFPSTGFYEAAARSVVGVAIGGNAIITADKLGLRQRLYGGQISARNAKYLTIPICAQAYGTTAKDWGSNLVLVILADGRKFLALWLGSEAAQASYDKNLTKLTKHAGTTANRVAKFRAAVGQQKPKVIIFKGAGTGGGAKQISRAEKYNNLKFLFVLKDSVVQAGNPLVIPQDLQEFALDQVKKAVQI